MSFVAFIVYKIVKPKIAKYILTPIISLLYGFMLFFLGMGINSVVYLVLAVIPVIFGAFYIFKQHNNKKN